MLLLVGPLVRPGRAQRRVAAVLVLQRGLHRQTTVLVLHSVGGQLSGVDTGRVCLQQILRLSHFPHVHPPPHLEAVNNIYAGFMAGSTEWRNLLGVLDLQFDLTLSSREPTLSLLARPRDRTNRRANVRLILFGHFNPRDTSRRYVGSVHRSVVLRN